MPQPAPSIHTSSMAIDLSVLVLVFTCCFSSCFSESRKELRTNEMNQEKAIRLGRPLPPNRIDPSRVTELSWRPRVFLYKGFLSDEECDHLVSLGNDRKKKSSGNSSTKPTNLDISLEIEDEITARIEERVSAWTFLPKGDGKPFHILHFGAEETHNTSTQLTNGESVLATVVMYLSNVTRGGQIIFPQSELESSSDCRKSNQIMRPIKGNSILFFSLHPNTSLDPRSSHVTCPIIEGDMWLATKIFVVKAIARPNSISDDLCTDEDDNCTHWAAIGECERNPTFMIGTTDYYGTCRKSCNVC